MKRSQYSRRYKTQHPWSLKDTGTILHYLSDRNEDAAFCNMGRLVNPKTYADGFPQLEGIVVILMSVDVEIRKRSLEWRHNQKSIGDSQTMAPQRLKRKARDFVDRACSPALETNAPGAELPIQISTCKEGYGDVAMAAGPDTHLSKRARPTTTHTMAKRARKTSAVNSVGTQIYEHPGPTLVAGEEEWKVDCVLTSRIKDNKLQYQVRWQGWEPDHNFYPAENFKGAPTLLQKFHDANPNSDGPPILLKRWTKAWQEVVRAPSHPNDNKTRSKKKAAKV